MGKTARYIYNPIRTVLVAVLLVAVLLFGGLYLALSLPAVQNKIRAEGEKALSQHLGTPVTIGEVSIRPFDQLSLGRVIVPDLDGDTLLAVDRLGAGVSLRDLLIDKKLVFTYAELVGMRLRVVRPDKESATNLQFVIDRLKPDGGSPPKPFDLQIRNVVIRKCDMTYDVLDEPHLSGRFDPNHVAVSGFRADVALPRLKNDDFDIQVKRLSLKEKSGFELKNLTAHGTVARQQTEVRGIRVELPNSQVNLGDITLNYGELGQIGQGLRQGFHQLDIHHSTVTPSDLKAFLPALGRFDFPLDVVATLSGNADAVSVPLLKIHGGAIGLDADVIGSASGLGDMTTLSFNLRHCDLSLRNGMLERVADALPGMSQQARATISRLESLRIDGSVAGTTSRLHFRGNVASGLGGLDLDGVFHDQKENGSLFSGHVATNQFDLGKLTGKSDVVGMLALDAAVDATLRGTRVSGDLDGHIAFVDIKGHRYHNITANVEAADGQYAGSLTANDPAGRLVLEGNARLDGAQTHVDLTAEVENLMPARLGMTGKIPVDALSFKAVASFDGDRLDSANGAIDLSDVVLTRGDESVTLDRITLSADNSTTPQRIRVESPVIEGLVEGTYDFATLLPSVRTLLARSFPELARQQSYTMRRPNDLDFHFTVNPCDGLVDMFKLPVKVLYPATLDGRMSETEGSFGMTLNAPYLLQGKKNIIEQTTLTARLDSATRLMTVQARTALPSKKGKIQIEANAAGRGDSLATGLAWRVDRDRDFSGRLDLSGRLARNPDGRLRADIGVNPTDIVFNDTVWQIQPGMLTVGSDEISVHNLAGQCDKQFVRVNGKVSRDPGDVLCLQLNDVSLDYVFETLNIDNVTFGGRATGEFYASDLFSSAPRLETQLLHVDNLSYNHAVMGDADIQSRWLNESKGVSLTALLKQRNGCESAIDGAIFVADDSLYLEFDAHRANVAFMKPFMEAFTSDVQGEVSGHAVLLGDFHNINLYGGIRADSLRFKLDYTNVYYTCSGDSVRMEPNLITFAGVRIHDRDGHEAVMDGWLRHDSFHRPVFSFSITGARDLLCYDTDAGINPVWYGTVYGNGAAFVTGEPGQVDIKVNMESAPGSRFTFVISDAQQASEYNFITFHDRDRRQAVPIERRDTVPDIVQQLTRQVQQLNEDQPTHYNIDLQGDITPDAQLVIVMDPEGGDQIKATGRGNMRLTYNDADEMTMFGKYVLEKGSYNFTLQDIIIKDFTIKDGSSISFQGDPYAAILDIEAVYSLNANLRDLDESFASDKEINRTNVPVHALLRAKGVMSEPDISFDLEFPTLPTDSYRKVKSIISTDDMMNRQIIYLLALNRFYTPDYMNATSNGNELSSVASSTLSSQLSNILGKMSDNWSISPNFRSNKGDFSDMEVDLALSSQLLNNRLLFNGNFGYRDNTYNTRNSNFIGDFDIEYLLNSKGTLRLKAYNHFNDQNYYVRNALTTQGLGIVWKHDFNRPFDFIRRSTSPDTTVTPVDTLHLTPPTATP